MLLSESNQFISPSEYLLQLLKDKSNLSSYSNNFLHINRLLDEEIFKVRSSIFNTSIQTEPLLLPEPLGPPVTLTEKLKVPVKDYPDFNFIGRLLGPRGLTAKQLELDTGCKILIRGEGSMRNKQKEEQMKGKVKWEHLNEDLHVLVMVEDSKNRAQAKLNRAVAEVKKLLLPIPENEDDLKKRQLTELAMLNGTYKGVLLTKTRELEQGLVLSSNSAPFLISPGTSQPIFFTSPIFSPLTSPLPMTPISSPAVHPQSLTVFSQPPSFSHQERLCYFHLDENNNFTDLNLSQNIQT